MSEDPQRVSFTVKELLVNLERKIDELTRKIDGRVAHVEQRVTALETRAATREHLSADMAALEVRLDSVEKEATWQQGARKAVWVAVTVLLAIAAMLVPIAYDVLTRL